jgi:hypothetical protein
MTFCFPKLFFNLRGISAGALSESKILKMSSHVRNPLKLGALYRKAGYTHPPVRRGQPVVFVAHGLALECLLVTIDIRLYGAIQYQYLTAVCCIGFPICTCIYIILV